VFDQTCFSFLIYDPITLRDSFKDGSCLEATKKWICQLSTSQELLAVENRGQRGSGSGTFSLPGVPLFVFFQSLIFGGLLLWMKTAVEEGAGKKLILALEGEGDDFL